MAKNLRAKIQESDTLIVHDVNTTATHEFLEEVEEGKDSGWKATSIAQDVREVAENAVSTNTYFFDMVFL